MAAATSCHSALAGLAKFSINSFITDTYFADIGLLPDPIF
jgi:hypothetical protein